MSVKDDIKAAMKMEGVTQKELAERIGYDYGALNYMLVSKFDMKMSKYKDIMEALGYSMELVKNPLGIKKCCESYLEKVKSGIAPVGRYFTEKDGEYKGLIRLMIGDRLVMEEKSFPDKQWCMEWLSRSVEQ